MKKLCLMICVSLLFTACGGSGAGTNTSAVPEEPKLTYTLNGKSGPVDPKAGYYATSTIATLIEVNGKSEPGKIPRYTFYFANFKLDKNNIFNSMTSPEQVRVLFTLEGLPGGDENTPLKAGTYPAKAPPGALNYDNHATAIFVVENGKEKDYRAERVKYGNTIGEVKITSVEGDKVTGEIDINVDNQMALKGSFTATKN